jgi:hypothetical protein
MPGGLVPPPPPPGSTAYGAAPAFGVQPAPPRTSSKALAAFILSLVAFVVCPIVASIAAIGLGSSAKQEIARSPGMGGRGLAQAGIVLGVIGLTLYGLVIVGVVLSDG